MTRWRLVGNILINTESRGCICSFFYKLHLQKFVNQYENSIGILSFGTHDQLDIFLAKYISMLHNDQDPEGRGSYQINTLNANVNFSKRSIYKRCDQRCDQKDINFKDLRVFQRQYD